MQTQSSNFKLNEENGEVNATGAIQTWLVQQLSTLLSLDAKAINVTEPLTRYGLDSIDAVTLVGDLEDWLEVELPSTLFWDHPTIEKSSQYIIENCEISAESLADEETEVVPQKSSEPSNGKKVGVYSDVSQGWQNGSSGVETHYGASVQKFQEFK